MLNKKHIKELFLITIIHECTKNFQNRLNKLYLFLGKSYVILHLMIKHYCHCLIATYEYCFKLNFWNLWNSQGERVISKNYISNFANNCVKICLSNMTEYAELDWVPMSYMRLYSLIKYCSNALISDNRIFHKIAWCYENWEFNINTILAQNKQLKEFIILYTLDIVKQRIFDQEGQEIDDTCVNVENSR